MAMRVSRTPLPSTPARNTALMSAVNTPGVRHHSASSSGAVVAAHRWRWDLRDVGDQALIRGLATAFPIMRPVLAAHMLIISGLKVWPHLAS